jgi:hypothetical protein
LSWSWPALHGAGFAAAAGAAPIVSASTAASAMEDPLGMAVILRAPGRARIG